MIHTLDNPNNIGNIHPDNKPQIGARLARLALAESYGIELGESVTGPVFKSAKLKKGGVLIKFTDTADSLVTTDNKAPTGFEVKVSDAGTNAPWVKAEAAIQGDRVLVTVPGKVPVAIRFCWLETDQTNLRNAEGLPPSPFLTTLAP
jgi:sialate O-acetylesterase